MFCSLGELTYIIFSKLSGPYLVSITGHFSVQVQDHVFFLHSLKDGVVDFVIFDARTGVGSDSSRVRLDTCMVVKDISTFVRVTIRLAPTLRHRLSLNSLRTDL